MKILHTADWHLGKRLEKFSRLEEQRIVLDEIITIANDEDVDVVLVAGDLFDAFNPSTEAIELLYKSLKRLTNNGKRLVVAIAGNHDSPDRVDAPDSLARACGILFAGYPQTSFVKEALDCGISINHSEPGFIELMLPQYDYPLRLIVTPYANEYRMKTFLGASNEEDELRNLLERQWLNLAEKYCDNKGVNVLIGHLFVMKKGEVPPEEPEDEKPILHIGGAQAIYSENIPKQMQYVALGHLHRYQEIDKIRMPIVYSSSPLSYSFAEAGQQKYVVIVDLKPNEVAVFKQRPLTTGKPLHKKRFEDINDAKEWLQQNQDTWVELTILSDDFMNAEDRRSLLQMHEGIVTIIPELRNTSGLANDSKSIDLSQSVDELFVQYFVYKNKQQPSEEILKLFKEIKAEQVEE